MPPARTPTVVATGAPADATPRARVVAFRAATRQVFVHCAERGTLLDGIRARQAALFGEVAARRVVHRVLGLAHEPPPPSLASLLMTPEEAAAAATETETDPAQALLPLATKRPTAAADDEGVARTRRRT